MPPGAVVANLAAPAGNPVTFRSVSFLFALVSYQQTGLNICVWWLSWFMWFKFCGIGMVSGYIMYRTPQEAIQFEVTGCYSKMHNFTQEYT